MWMLTQILVKTRIAPLSILRDVREQIVQIDREQQVMRLCDLKTWITWLEECAQQWLVATLSGFSRRWRWALAAVGPYSFVSYGVATRTTIASGEAARCTGWTSVVVWIIMPQNRAKRVFPMGIVRCRGACVGSTQWFSNEA